MNNKLALEAGLYPAGLTEEGEQEYIGTRQQWEKYQELENNNLELKHECKNNSYRKKIQG